MIIVKFHGGLGNQIFQYCFYKELKLKYPEIIIKADLTRYQYDKYLEHNGFELDKVFKNIELEEASLWEILVSGGFVERKRDGITDAIIRKITTIISDAGRKLPLKYRKMLYEDAWCQFEKEEIINIGRRNITLYGYWAGRINSSITDFQFNVQLDAENARMLEKIIDTESISIHVRRGDYVGTSFDVLTEKYYIKAKELIDNRIINPVYFIFSDDSDYIEEKFTFMKKKIIIKNNRDANSYIDMFLMSQCKHNIICNSTFSFWGAKINKNPKKLVIAPRFYIKNLNEEVDEWLLID